MRNRKKNQKKLQLQVDPNELIAKQSARTTFKLSEKTSNLLKVAAKHLGIKQKTLLDQLLEDKKALNILADDAITYARNDHKCRPKTMVLSQKALDQIETVSSYREIPRDYLVELSVARLASYFNSSAKTHEKRGLLMEELDRHNSQLIDLFNRNERMLHKDDAFWVRFKTLTEITHKQVEKIRKTFKDKSEFEY
ncbi:MAG: hypothetical protein HKP41_01380 [Desulfobacterales bacterium]|nr:hypothetical protein [Desulfobacterales bacterium]